MKITYDLPYTPEPGKCRKGVKSEELLAFIAFMESDKKNMCFEYDDRDMATRKCVYLRTYRKNHDMEDKVDIIVNLNRIFIVKKAKKVRKAS